MPKKGGKKNVRVKAKPANGMSRNAPRKPSAKRAARPQRQLLDGAAVAYAQLLRDPCNGPLVGFYGGAGGYIQRFSSVLTVGQTAGTVAGILSICPGAGIVGYQDVTTDLSSATVSYGPSSFPGQAFLAANAKGFRVLALCVKAYTNASENARSGFISYGVMPMTEAPQQGTAYATPIAAQQLMPRTVRTPGDMVEVRWKPGNDDREYNHNSPGTTIDARSGEQNAIVCAWTGQPAAVGFRVVITAVIEWLPAVSTGFVTNAMAPAMSAHTVDEVVRTLSMSNPEWWHNAGQVAVRVAKSAALGYAKSGLLGSVVGGLAAITL